MLGRPLKIVIEDDKSDAKEAVTAANRLIDQEKAVAIIAATGSASTLAVKAITAAKGLPQIAMAAANDITDEAPMEWIWRTPHKDAMAAARALTYMSESLQGQEDRRAARRERFRLVGCGGDREERRQLSASRSSWSSRTRPTTPT